jgi:RsiW-degrading membrane proteinase PrsW (M82 family)
MIDLTQLFLLFVFAYLPPLLYTIWFRNTERHHRQHWIPLMMCFLWGATIAIMAALILEILLNMSLQLSHEPLHVVDFLLLVVVAPFAEELTKPLALLLRTVKKELVELEDGLIYGAVAGLGFSATENLFYGNEFLAEGLLAFIMLMLLRSFGGCLLHASATSLTGYGYGKTLLKKTSILYVIPYLLLAMAVHGLYNFLVSIEFYGVLSGLIAALLFVMVTVHYIRKKIRVLDAEEGG